MFSFGHELILFAPYGDVMVGEDIYVGFTPYANILRSYRALRLNAMCCGSQ